jgi:hypothetical protein
LDMHRMTFAEGVSPTSKTMAETSSNGNAPFPEEDFSRSDPLPREMQHINGPNIISYL